MEIFFQILSKNMYNTSILRENKREKNNTRM